MTSHLDHHWVLDNDLTDLPTLLCQASQDLTENIIINVRLNRHTSPDTNKSDRKLQ